MSVSVIIPARNAGESIRATLDSLVAQEWTDWAAVVIDDGSADATRSIVDSFAARDRRITVIDGPRRGTGAARNAGLAALDRQWVLFLDADDTLEPAMLRRMMETLAANPEADAVHCGWTFTDWAGAPLSRWICPSPGPDLFPLAGRTCPFAIHACVFRRSLLARAGGFDEMLVTSEDFDLWQRIARVGTRFVALDEYLATYRLRARQSWSDAGLFLKEALAVVRRGHAPDPRLAGQELPAEHAQGLPAEGLYAAEAHMVVWAAGMRIARGEDPVALLDALPAAGPPLFEPEEFAQSLFRAVPMVDCRPPSAWFERWAELEPRLTAFFRALEARTGVVDLASQVAAALEGAIAREMLALLDDARPVIALGSMAAVRIEIRTELTDLALPGAQRAVCHVHDDGAYLGLVVLPVIDGQLSRAVVRDAIAARFAWPLLGGLFSAQIYPHLLDEQAGEEWTVRRALLLGDKRPAPEELHDRIGWAVLLQELLGLPNWPSGRFYDETAPHPNSAERGSNLPRASVELSLPLPTFTAISGTLDIEVTVGGARLLSLQLGAQEGRNAGVVSSARIRAATLDQAHLELARVAAREGIVGYHGDGDVPLRERLRRAFAAAHEPRSSAVPPGASDSSQVADRLLDATVRDLPAGGTTIIGAPAGFAPSETARRAELPRDLAATIVANLRPPHFALAIGDDPASRAFVLPELPAGARPAEPAAQPVAAGDGGGIPALYGRHHFERLFSSGANPWKYTSPYEQTKYEQTLSLLPAENRAKVLEIGCAEGHFTVQVAPLVGHLLATDIADLGLERTRERCADLINIAYARLDILKDPVAGTFDAIFCCELLYYMGGLAELRKVGAKIAAALGPGGVLITAHANLVVDEPKATGFDWSMPYGAKRIGEAFAAVPELEFEHELLTPLYRIQRFRKRQRSWLSKLSGRSAAATVTRVPYGEPVPEVAAHILWEGGKVAAPAPVVTTARLPILMYHVVADSGPEPLARWRVTPALFEAQLRYLREAGFEPAGFDEWRTARERRTPLPGRRVIVTFDDIYADFEQAALPILRRYGFPATLFVPSDKIGGRADWDAWAGPPLPLIDLEGLRRARDAGMRIGSHGAGHRQFAGLPVRALVDELSRSRATLEQALAVEVDTLAYPSGSFDEVAERVAAACFYRHAVITRDQLSTLGERELALSRIEVRGGQDLPQFIQRLPE